MVERVELTHKTHPESVQRVYDHYDPTLIRISIGAETGIISEGCCPGTYGVRGNAPDPAVITLDSGLVKYEPLGGLSDNPYVSAGNDERRTLGVFLAQMLDNRTIKVEVVLDRTADEVDGFSDSARIYRR